MKILFALLLVYRSDAFLITKAEPGVVVVAPGARVTLFCAVDDHYEWCKFYHPSGEFCDFEWKRSESNITMQECGLEGRVQFYGEYDDKECGVTFRAEVGDTGVWRCEIEEYVTWRSRGAGRVQTAQMNVTVQAPTTVPSIVTSIPTVVTVTSTEETTPIVKITTSTEKISTTNVSSETSELSTETSELSTETSELSTETSELSTETSELSTETSELSTETSELSKKTSELSTETSELSTETSELSTKTSELSTETSELSIETSELSTQTSEFEENHGNKSESPEAVPQVDENENDKAGGSSSVLIGVFLVIIVIVVAVSGAFYYRKRMSSSTATAIYAREAKTNHDQTNMVRNSNSNITFHSNNAGRSNLHEYYPPDLTYSTHTPESQA